MPVINLTLDQLREALENLNPEEFKALNRLLDHQRRSRLAEIVQKTRQHAATMNADQAESVVCAAIAEVRAENAANRRS